MDFKLAIINYALNPVRLLLIGDTNTWQDFPNLDEAEECIAASELRELFLKEILPNIDNYELTQNQKYILEMLQLHPSFIKTNQGYTYINLSEKLLESKDIFRKSHFGVGQPKVYADKIDECIVSNVRQKSYIDSYYSPLILKDESIKDKRNMLSIQTSAALSLFISSNGELSYREMFDIAEIHNRLKDAKRNFVKTGRLPESFQISLDELLNRFRKITELKVKFEELCQQGDIF